MKLSEARSLILSPLPWLSLSRGVSAPIGINFVHIVDIAVRISQSDVENGYSPSVLVAPSRQD
jgi:hypothetical protein